MDQTKRTAKLTALQTLAPLVTEFVLDFEQDFSFQAGQFLAVHFETNRGPVTRFYSIASDPSNKRQVKLCIKILEGAEKPASRYFENLKIGDTLSVSGPGGSFVFRGKQEHILLLATGTGLAPMLSLLASELPKLEHNFTLLFGVRTQADFFHLEYLSKLQTTYPKHFTYELILSRPEGTAWQGKTGHITDYLKELESLQSSEAYLCGNPTMVIEARQKLTELGLAEEAIFSEAY